MMWEKEEEEKVKFRDVERDAELWSLSDSIKYASEVKKKRTKRVLIFESKKINRRNDSIQL